MSDALRLGHPLLMGFEAVWPVDVIKGTFGFSSGVFASVRERLDQANGAVGDDWFRGVRRQRGP